MKQTACLISGFMALSLSACGATTGGVAQNLAKQAAVNTVSNYSVNSAETDTAVPSPVNYSDMDCAALAIELVNTESVILASNQTIAGGGSANIAGQAAAAGASQLALKNGAAGALARVPFGGLFARKAMNAVVTSGQSNIEQAQADLQNAQLRKASLSGVYTGKGCVS